MFNIFDKLKNRNIEQKNTVPATPDFIQTYVLCDPNTILADYSIFKLCKEIPVAYESNGTFKSTVKLPNVVPVARYLHNLEIQKKEIVAKPENRTVSIIKADNGFHMYILPNLEPGATNKNTVFFVADKPSKYFAGTITKTQVFKTAQENQK